MKKLLVFVVVLMAFTTAAQDILKGQVVDAASGKPIPFAKVFFPDLQTGLLADSAGVINFDRAPNGSFKIRVSASGFETAMLEFNLQEGKELLVQLKPSHIMLDKVIVSSSEGILQRESITNIESVKLSDINAIPSATIGESMSNIPGVYQTTIGPGISKPVVRGLSGPRVVSYLNGMRLENQQWGADHGMGITDVGIGSVEVIRGPSSLLYGSDAMGGVYCFRKVSIYSCLLPINIHFVLP